MIDFSSMYVIWEENKMLENRHKVGIEIVEKVLSRLTSSIN